MNLRVTRYPIVPEYVVRRLEGLIWRATFVMTGPPLDLYVVPAPAVGEPGACGFGVFLPPADGHSPQIWLAGHKPDDEMSDADHADMLAGTFAHELVHYEQWRDGRPLTERGVAVRARTILKMLAAQPSGRPG